jgi:hypothetical protein
MLNGRETEREGVVLGGEQREDLLPRVMVKSK